jgi:hypothetical protein
VFTEFVNGLHQGTFVYLYKFLLNSLPMLYPGPRAESLPITYDLTRTSTRRVRSNSHSRRIHTSEEPEPERLALSANARRLIVRKRTRRWHAIVSGGVAGGLAVMFERADRRTTIAQQLFVR